MVERRREEQHEAVAAPDEVLARPRPSPARARDRSAAPERTLHDWAIESIRHSALLAEPSGVPSSKKARRYQSPSQPCALERAAQRLHVRPPALGTRRARRAPRRSATKRGERRDAGTSRARRSRPAPRGRRGSCRRSSRRSRSAAGRGRRPPRLRSMRPRRSARRAIADLATSAPAGSRRRPGPAASARSLEERDRLVEDRRVAGDREVAVDGVGQPEPVVGDARADAAAGRRMPPVLDVALDELTRRGAQEVLAGELALRRRSARSRPGAGRGSRTRRRPGRSAARAQSRQASVW